MHRHLASLAANVLRWAAEQLAPPSKPEPGCCEASITHVCTDEPARPEHVTAYDGPRAACRLVGA